MNRFTPKFLQKFDRRLLLTRPHVWVTRIHIVAYWCALAMLLLAAAALAKPAGAYSLDKETFNFAVFLILAVVACIAWIYLQSRNFPMKPGLRSGGGRNLLTTICYISCLLMILSLPYTYLGVRFAIIHNSLSGVNLEDDKEKLDVVGKWLVASNRNIFYSGNPGDPFEYFLSSFPIQITDEQLKTVEKQFSSRSPKYYGPRTSDYRELSRIMSRDQRTELSKYYPGMNVPLDTETLTEIDVIYSEMTDWEKKSAFGSFAMMDEVDRYESLIAIGAGSDYRALNHLKLRRNSTGEVMERDVIRAVIYCKRLDLQKVDEDRTKSAMLFKAFEQGINKAERLEKIISYFDVTEQELLDAVNRYLYRGRHVNMAEFRDESFDNKILDSRNNLYSVSNLEYQIRNHGILAAPVAYTSFEFNIFLFIIMFYAAVLLCIRTRGERRPFIVAVLLSLGLLVVILVALIFLDEFFRSGSVNLEWQHVFSFALAAVSLVSFFMVAGIGRLKKYRLWAGVAVVMFTLAVPITPWMLTFSYDLWAKTHFDNSDYYLWIIPASLAFYLLFVPWLEKRVDRLYSLPE